MDGNRRYGRLHYPQNPLQGHVKGAQKLSEMISWCVKRRLPILTVYCFSTENWNRPPEEVQGLWDLMLRQSRHDLLQQARQDQIRITVISTQWERVRTITVEGVKIVWRFPGLAFSLNSSF
jgi:tritrans,polycis-undecaprenyl-diphosphate synthase [geranylgeranyl-diphosphate specific]